MLSALGAAGLYETLVRPVIEYGAEIDSGQWDKAERLQLLAGRLALGLRRNCKRSGEGRVGMVDDESKEVVS
jgi:hypothetical protein